MLRRRKWQSFCSAAFIVILLLTNESPEKKHQLKLQTEENRSDAPIPGSRTVTMSSTRTPVSALRSGTLIFQPESSKENTKNHTVMQVKGYIQTVKKFASKKGVIFLATVDYSFVDMAINLYLSSFLPWGISNYLFVCSHHHAKEVLHGHGINAVHLWNDVDGNNPSDFATAGFNRKTTYKTRAATLALDHGFTIIVIDVDIVFLKDPRPYLTCKRCDLIMQSEGTEYYRNTGFYLAYPTAMTIKLHHLVLNTYKSSRSVNDQQSFNTVLPSLEVEGNLKVKVLGLDSFPNGEFYFDKGQRMFAGDHPCSKCFLVHNNFVASFSNKRYRFREHLMWHFDKNEYYSNPTAKYLTYRNRVDFGAARTPEMEEEALTNAFLLGNLLQRIVILPRFYCYKCPMDICLENHSLPHCSAYVHYNMSAMDELLEDHYREHMFLHNNLVPAAVKESQSDEILIKSKVSSSELMAESKLEFVFTPSNSEEGATEEEITEWLKPFARFSVLRFHSLYGQILSPETTLGTKYKLSTGVRSLHRKKKVHG